jgi:hypothetical protein
MEQLGSHVPDFYKILVVFHFSKNRPQYSRFIKTCHEQRALYEDKCTFLLTSRWILLRTRNISDRSCRENQNTHFMFDKFYLKLCRLWVNVVGGGELYSGTGHRWKNDACALQDGFHKATNTPSEYVILFFFFFFTATVVSRKRLDATLYVHGLSFFFKLQCYMDVRRQLHGLVALTLCEIRFFTSLDSSLGWSHRWPECRGEVCPMNILWKC